MIIYFTYNEQPSGIFNSQVADVVNYLNTFSSRKVKLVSFISMKSFFKNRRIIKAKVAKALVLPMFPKLKNWKRNVLPFRVIINRYQPEIIVARSVLATQLAFLSDKKNKSKIIYDGRGAIFAEWTEYKVVTDEKMLSTIYSLEKECVNNSYYNMSVSQALVSYWNVEFNYTKNNYVIIPCTLSSYFEKVTLSEDKIKNIRISLGVNENDCLLIYSGSAAGWQGGEKLFNFLQNQLKNNQHVKVLFLSPPGEIQKKLQTEFLNRVIQKQVLPNQVPEILQAGDYGILIRELSTTNRVASPVKYAEYLACGLKVIISENLGDYSEFTIKNELGFIHTNINKLTRLDFKTRTYLSNFAKEYFSKKKYINYYQQIINL